MKTATTPAGLANAPERKLFAGSGYSNVNDVLLGAPEFRLDRAGKSGTISQTGSGEFPNAVLRHWYLWLPFLAFALPAIGSDDASPMPSIFLVAKKDLGDPFFQDSVVLVTHRAGPVPIGVIINRPTPVPLSRAAPEFEKSPAKAKRVFFGGPVSPEALVVVFRDATRPQDAIEVLPGVYLSSSPEVLREILGRAKPVKDVRVFAGHAAWSPGQLEGEVARGGWHLVPADADAIFEAKPEDLWRKLERRAATKMLRHSGSMP